MPAYADVDMIYIADRLLLLSCMCAIDWFQHSRCVPVCMLAALVIRPHVAGAAARLWSKGACSNVTTCATMLTDCQATPGMVQGGIGAAPNKLLHVNPGI